MGTDSWRKLHITQTLSQFIYKLTTINAPQKTKLLSYVLDASYLLELLSRAFQKLHDDVFKKNALYRFNKAV